MVEEYNLNLVGVNVHDGMWMRCRSSSKGALCGRMRANVTCGSHGRVLILADALKMSGNKSFHSL